MPPTVHPDLLLKRKNREKMSLEEAIALLLQESDLGTSDQAMELMGRLALTTDFFHLVPGESAHSLGNKLLTMATAEKDMALPPILVNFTHLKRTITRQCASASTLLERLRHAVLSYDEAAHLIADRYDMGYDAAMALMASQNPPILDAQGHLMEWDSAPILQRLHAGDETTARSYYVETGRLRELLLFAKLPEPFPQWWPEQPTGGATLFPHAWDFLPRDEPHRGRVIAICRGAEMSIDGDQEGHCRYGGKLSAARIARLARTTSRYWWPDPQEPVPTERTLTEWITLWLKAGIPKTDTLGQEST